MVNPHKLSEFVKNNLKIILQEGDNTLVIKEIKKRDFVNNWNKQFGIPKDREIADEAIRVLIRIGRVKTLEDIEQIKSKVLFIRKNIIESHKFKAYLDDSDNTVISNEDLSLIGKKEFAEKHKKEIISQTENEVKQIKEEGLKEVKLEKKKIEEEKEKLIEIRKEIQSLRIDEDQITRELENFNESQDINTRKIWWKELGFFSDPFPGENKGLMPTVESRFISDEKITEEEKNNFFNSVLIKDHIFNDFEFKLNENLPDFLNNTYIIIGGFGSGKTVLFEFVELEATRNGIFTLPIWLDAKQDVENMHREFYKELIKSKQLKGRFQELFNVDVRARFINFDKDDFCDALLEIKGVVSFKGILIIIDGLHKSLDLTRSALKFIIAIQNLSDKLFNEGINASFIIAGDNSWMNDIKNDPAFSGSFNKNNLIPLTEVNVHEAYEMFNKRFKAFSKQKDNHTRIPKTNVELLNKRLKGRLTRPLSFRDYIDELLPSLKEGDINNVHVNPLFAHDTIDKVYQILKSKYENFIQKLTAVNDYFTKNPQNTIRLLKVLVGIDNFKSINDPYFNHNKPFIHLLLKFDLISEGIQNDLVGVKPSNEIKLINSFIKNNYGYSFNDIIISLTKLKVLNKEDIKKESKEEVEEVRAIRNLLKQNYSLNQKLAEKFSKIVSIHNELITNKDIKNDLIIIKTKENIRDLLWIIFDILGFKSSWDFDSLNRKILSESFNWLFEYIKDYEVYWNKLVQLKKTISPTKAEFHTLIWDYKRSFISIIKLIEQLVSYNHYLSLNRLYLKQSDLKPLHDIRHEWIENNYKKCLSGFSEYYEDKMRNNLFNFMIIKYGHKYHKTIGKIVNEHIHSNKEKNQRCILHIPDDGNILFCADRSDYPLIILGQRGEQINREENWEQIFSHIFGNLNTITLEHYFNIILPFLIGDAHKWNKEVWEKNSDKLREAVNAFVDIVESLNKGYMQILNSDYIHIIDEEVYFSFYKNLNDKCHLIPVEINKEKFTQIWNQFSSVFANKKYMAVDLESSQDIEHSYNCKYREFIAVIAIAIKKEKLSIKFSNGNYILIKNK